MLTSLSLTEGQKALFWAKVDKSGDCWLWKASKTPLGYGRAIFKTNDGWRPRLAHRAAYILSKGPIPEGLVIDHLCHNPGCVNPAHLRATTPKRNNENRIGPNRNSKSGIRGVCWDKQSGKWKVQVGHANRIYRGGFFDDLAGAEAAAIALRAELHSTTPGIAA